jgi:hypothetical protein
VRIVQVPDRGVTLDMDTPAEYRELAEYCRASPSAADPP